MSENPGKLLVCATASPKQVSTSSNGRLFIAYFTCFSVEFILLDFSAGPLAGASINDFDPNQRIRLRNIIQTKPGGEKNLLALTDDELDKALRFTTEVDGKVYPTVTGMLILGKENRIAELMPTVKASFQVLEGTKVRINAETSAPLLEVFEKFETYAEAWNPEREVEYGLFRVAVPEFDKAAFREGLINAGYPDSNIY